MLIDSSLAVPKAAAASLATAPRSGQEVDASVEARRAARVERGRHHDPAVARQARIAAVVSAVVGLSPALTTGAR
jgi:hypothetical protein